jgi:hypothetical protein
MIRIIIKMPALRAMLLHLLDKNSAWRVVVFVINPGLKPRANDMSPPPGLNEKFFRTTGFRNPDFDSTANH